MLSELFVKHNNIFLLAYKTLAAPNQLIGQCRSSWCLVLQTISCYLLTNSNMRLFVKLNTSIR